MKIVGAKIVGIEAGWGENGGVEADLVRVEAGPIGVKAGWV
jgi:hypothetical protein